MDLPKSLAGNAEHAYIVRLLEAERNNYNFWTTALWQTIGWASFQLAS